MHAIMKINNRTEEQMRRQANLKIEQEQKYRIFIEICASR
jgi:hypothetical protein